MNEALISIGSNFDKEINIFFCQKKLLDFFSPEIQASDLLETAPCGKQYTENFLNQVFRVKTEKSRTEVCFFLKNLEIQVGRRDEDKLKGLIKIDIDLIEWNRTILKEEDMEREYMPLLLDSIPNTI